MEITTLVLLPGMDGTGTLFAPFLEAFPADFPIKVVTYPTSLPLSYEELKEVAKQAVPPDGPLVILGESFSGPIAVSLAAELGLRVRGLVLCATFIRNPRPSLASLRAMVNVLPISIAPSILATHLLFGKFATPKLRALLKDALSRVSASVLRSRLRSVLAVDAAAALKSLRMPVLYLRATKDALVPQPASELVVQLCPHARVVSFVAPHCLMQVVPKEAAAEVVSFVRQTRNQ